MQPRTATDLPIDLQGTALRVVSTLSADFSGVFGAETVEHLVVSTMLDQIDQIDDSRSLWRNVEDASRHRLQGLVDGVRELPTTPHVLFLCTHAAGRSQIAAAWTAALAGDRVTVGAAGSAPAAAVHAAVVTVMAEVGIDLGAAVPAAWDDDMVRDADVVVTMGCGDTCPIVEGPRYVDWPLPDPADLELDEVRRLRDEVRTCVVDLLESLGVPSDPDPASPTTD